MRCHIIHLYGYPIILFKYSTHFSKDCIFSICSFYLFLLSISAFFFKKMIYHCNVLLSCFYGFQVYMQTKTLTLCQQHHTHSYDFISEYRKNFHIHRKYLKYLDYNISRWDHQSIVYVSGIFLPHSYDNFKSIRISFCFFAKFFTHFGCSRKEAILRMYVIWTMVSIISILVSLTRFNFSIFIQKNQLIKLCWK